MFVNFAILKNFHSKKLYITCNDISRINNRGIRIGAPKCASVICNFPAVHLKSFKYLLLKKSKFKDLEILRRNLTTGSRLFSNKKDSSKNEEDPKNPQNQFNLFGLYALLAISTLYVLNFRSPNNDMFISWEEFKHELLAKGEVKNLTVYLLDNVVIVELHEGAVIRNLPKRMYYAIKVPEIRIFEDKLREAEEELGISVHDKVPVTYRSNTYDNIKNLALTLSLPLLLILISLLLKYGKSFSLDTTLGRTKYTLIDPLMGGGGKGVKFSDVAGLKEAKTEIMDFVDYLKRPEIYRSLGARVPKGALLLGPPGCGKTLLAKAVATEANVPFLSMNGSEFIEIIGGLGAARVRDLFKDAKKRIPCIIYIDEIDAVGKKRESFDYGSSEADQTLNQLLVEMDGVVSNEGIVLLASTNRADVLDKALLRPGRFDRHILIDLPTFQERQEIFEYHLKSIHLEHKPQVYSKRMAHLTPGFSGADIANVCNEAALHAARLQKQIVQGDDLEYAVERVVGGTEKRSSARTPEEKKLFAYYEAGRALVGWVSKYGEALLKITIVARTDTPAGWTHFAPNDKHLYSVDDLRGKMCMGLGGRAAITLLFNRVTTAGEKDLEKVTKLAYAQVRRFGMSENIGLMSFDVEGSQGSTKKPYSKVLGNMFDQEARRLVAEAYKETEKLILENKDKLVKLAEELLVKETLNYEEVVKLIGPPSFEGKTLVEPLEFAYSFDQALGPEPDKGHDRKNQ